MDKWLVYRHTNIFNGKMYIGITRQSPQKRWRNGLGYSGLVFGKAIKKYGWDAFRHEVLYTNLTEEEACKKEIELIAKYRTSEPKYGYNRSPGGNVMSAEAREKLSKQYVGKNNPMYGKPRGENNLRSTRKAAVCIETQIIYESISQASRMTGINLGHIAEVCRGERKTAGGLHWMFAEFAGGDGNR